MWFLRFSVPNRVSFLTLFAAFLVWSLDRVAKLHYLILECEKATLYDCRTYVILGARGFFLVGGDRIERRSQALLASDAPRRGLASEKTSGIQGIHTSNVTEKEKVLLFMLLIISLS